MGLAARLTRVTLRIVVVSVALALFVAVMSTSKLSRSQTQSADVVMMQHIEDSVELRLNIAGMLMDQAADAAVDASSDAAVGKRVAAVIERGDVAFVDGAVITHDGRVLWSQSDAPAAQVLNSTGYRMARSGVHGALDDRSSRSSGVWFARTAARPDGDAVFVIARQRVDFVRALVVDEAAAAPNRGVVVLSGSRIVAASGAARLPASAEWSSAGTGHGTVRFKAAGKSYSGQFSAIGGPDKIGWRVVVFEPADLAFKGALAAALPPILVLALGGLVAVAAAWAVSSRLVRPLRDLERTARIAAVGSYVKPLPTDRDDEIGRVAEAFNAVALRLNALNDLSQLLASASRLDQVLDGILSAISHILGPGAAAIYLLDENGTRLAPARTRGADMASAQPVQLDGMGWLAAALSTSDPDVLNGPAEMIAAEVPGLEGEHNSVLAAPLVAGHEALGVVVVMRGDEPLSEAQLEMVRTFSAQAAVAVQTSRLFEEESSSRHTAEALRAVAEQLVRPEGLDATLQTVAHIIGVVFGSSYARVALVDPAAVGLAVPEDRSADDEVLATGRRVLSSSGDAVIIDRASDTGVDAILEREGGVSLLVVPVALDSDHGAVLAVALPEDADLDGAVVVGEALADEIALALDNAYFYERALVRAANLENIFRISQAVGSSLQVNVVLNRVLDVVQKILSADGVVLWAYDKRKRALGSAMVRGNVPAGFVGVELREGEDLPGRVFASREPVAVHNLDVSMGGIAESAVRHDLRSLIAVPLLARGRAVGVLMVLSAKTDAFTDEDVSMLQTFGSQAALAIDTARMYSREHEVATVLQESILPEALAEFDYVVASSVYAPAGADIEIGGDYYDAFEGPDGSAWFAIADVCGKGVHAATKTSMIKYTVRAFVAAGLDPSAAMHEVNRMIHNSGAVSDIVTLWLGRYLVAEGTLEWADGGHPPAILKRSDGELLALGTTGPLLGAAEDVVYGLERVPFSAGDRIVLYTDGVTEARVRGVFFGEERVREYVALDTDVRHAARGLLEAVQSFVRAQLRDDVAILVVEARDSRVDTAEEPGRKAAQT